MIISAQSFLIPLVKYPHLLTPIDRKSGSIIEVEYNKPLFVSEGGLADHDDSDRAEYITRQVEGVRRAIADGADVRGHLYWSLMDNYEWALGTAKQFGLIKINYDTLEREIRPSAWVYKELIEKYSKVQ